MTNNDKNLLLESTATMGNHGIACTNIKRLDQTLIWVEDETQKSIFRFSYDGSLLVKITFLLNSQKNKETIYISPKFIIDGLAWDVTLGFEKTNGKYGFAGLFGGDGIAFNGYESVPSDVYTNAKNIIIEMSNPDFDCGNEYHSDAIDSIIDLLRKCSNKRINHYFLSRWDKKIVDKQKKYKQLTKEKNPIVPK